MALPQHKIIYENLKNQIIGGVYQEGDLLPSENQLSQLHASTRTTVRQALGDLQKEGYIEKHRGKGSFVTSQKSTLGLLSFRGFSEVVGQTEHLINTEMLQKPRLQKWPDPFFYSLDPPEQNAGCIFLKRLRKADDDSVMLESTYIPNLRLTKFTSKPLINNSLFSSQHILHQIDVVNLDQEVRAIRCDKEIARKLKLKEGDPILHIYRKYGTNREGFYIYSELQCNTEKYAMGSFFK